MKVHTGKCGIIYLCYKACLLVPHILLRIHLFKFQFKDIAFICMSKTYRRKICIGTIFALQKAA